MERAELRALVRATGCAVEQGEFVFLGSPAASTAERSTAEVLFAHAVTANEATELGWLCIRTGGSSGAMKFARHDERTISAAVEGFTAHFGLRQVNAIDVLPAYHVSGLMARARCASTGGTHIAWEWKRLEAGELPAVAAGDWVLSLVPTQLQRLLGVPRTVEWLRNLKIIFVGGGPIWPALADAADQARLRVALSYGMTETAAMVTALQPEDFLAGARSAGAVMPHAHIAIAPGEGVVTVTGESVFRGYWPERRITREFTTEDLGRLDARGHLHVLGRRDAVIITGGKKVNPVDVEAVLRASGEFTDVAVIGVPDPEWGEAVVACFPEGRVRKPDFERAVIGLSPEQRPKRFLAVALWPRNAQGKLNRAALREAISDRLQGSAGRSDIYMEND